MPLLRYLWKKAKLNTKDNIFKNAKRKTNGKEFEGRMIAKERKEE